jgi:hypothetical protein
MKTAVKGWLINAAVVLTGTMTLLFSFGATWIILHRSSEIIRDLPVESHTVLGATLAIGLILIWLNSMLLDSVAWTINKCWKPTGKNIN